MIFRQLFDARRPPYLPARRAPGGSAVLIDPVLEQVRRDTRWCTTWDSPSWRPLDTVHADHVTGAAAVRARTGAKVCACRRPAVRAAPTARCPMASASTSAAGTWSPWPTPGHTAGCMTFILDDRSDGLHRRLPADPRLRGAPISRAASASRALYASVRERIFALPDTCHPLPGPTTVASMATAGRGFQPQAGRQCKARSDFAGHMKHLDLPHPKRIDRPFRQPAVRPGRRARGHGGGPDWAPLSYSFTGIWGSRRTGWRARR